MRGLYGSANAWSSLHRDFSTYVQRGDMRVWIVGHGSGNQLIPGPVFACYLHAWYS